MWGARERLTKSGKSKIVGVRESKREKRRKKKKRKVEERLKKCLKPEI